ncbi:MAG: outer membrane protein assembly factor BamC [gamma proteobacterium endosymbiont of Lamellibrachia anaximandri]|nr:outer membrane protein assembly factor BamC [gamma proteobacterium endosymbiont of Lamellibrachia anaximandri]MBL3534046.1 outer membrane protein assembly factor BamC [gamma proteobacterium endosymbiont of Lamellibrachia anaximandri]MBL3599216.1 outer membrane protein assembly factor BamC [gamma proteobacterium endosymbiont of Lamellibrachia anaximandri]
MLHTVKQLILIPALAVLLHGCSSTGDIFSDKQTEYRNQREMVDNLEVPPDLSRSAINDALSVPEAGAAGSASYSEYTTNRQGGGATTPRLAGSTVLPQVKDIEVKRDGDQRWLLINATPDDVWPRVVEFWRQNGLLLVEQDPTVGIMRTDWLESRADVKQGTITELFRKVLDSVYSSATRDQFRVRLEEGEKTGTTELYLTHRGLEEKLVEKVGGDADTTYWTPRPNDPGVEVEMLRRLMVYLGVSGENAEQALARKEERKARSELVKSANEAYLIINEGFARGWRLTGVALDRVGFAVEDRNRSEGVYFVRYIDPDKDGGKEKGFFSKLAFWSDDKVDSENQYQVKLEAEGKTSRVTVLNSQGERDNSSTALRILTLLHENIR